MSDQRDKRFVQESIDSGLSTMHGDPWLAQRIINHERTGGIIVNKRISVSLVLAIVLASITITALAVTLLSGKDFIQSFLAPLSKETDSIQWTDEELDRILQYAQKQEMALPDNIREKLASSDPVYKEELLRLFMKMDMGFYPASWPLEEQAWYDELLVQYGLKEERTRFMPEESEISQEQALSIARDYILKTWQVNVSDDGQFALYIQYMLTEDATGNRCKRWDITYEQEDHSRYYVVSITPTGEIATAEANIEQEETQEAAQQPDTGKEMLDLMIAMWQDDFYTVESLAAFSDRYGDLVRAIDNDWEQTKVLKAMLEIPYALPRTEDILPDAAMQNAKEAALANGWSEEQLALCRHSISYRAYPGEESVYRVCFKLNDGTENRRLFYDGKMPFGIVIYLDPVNGEIKQINTLKQLDYFERFCEFPDVHDRTQNNGLG